jgi:hypothetical protein
VRGQWEDVRVHEELIKLQVNCMRGHQTRYRIL